MNVPRARDSGSRARTRRRLDFAVKRREDLVRVLAPDYRCAECRELIGVRELVIDHVDGITWDRYRMSPQMRAAKYWREHNAGVRLRALCNTCSVGDGNRRRAMAIRHRRKRRR